MNCKNTDATSSPSAALTTTESVVAQLSFSFNTTNQLKPLSKSMREIFDDVFDDYYIPPTTLEVAKLVVVEAEEDEPTLL